MSTQRFSPEFKEETVRQVLERDYSVTEAARLGVSTYSLYKWVKAVTPPNDEKQAAELMETKSEILCLHVQMRPLGQERALVCADISNCLEIFYAPQKVLLEDNRTRRHSHLGHVSSEAFERASL